MNDFSPAGHPRDPVGRFATKPLAESGAAVGEPYATPRYTEAWAPLTHPYLELISQKSTPNDDAPDLLPDDEEFTYRVTGRMRDDILAACGRTGEDVPVTLVTDDAECGTDSTREQNFCLDVYVGEGRDRQEVFSEYSSGPDSALAKFLRWIDS